MSNASPEQPAAPKRALEAVHELNAYPASLARTERDLLARTARVGLGISGGGIRSATFALGVAQGVARAKLLRTVDIMSTVSGGGYFGSFYGHLLQRSRRPSDPVRRELADEVLADPNAPAINFVRANGRYLAPSGTGDLFTAAASVLRNWASALVVVGCVVLLAFSLLALLRYTGMAYLQPFVTAIDALPRWLSPWVLVMIGVTLAASIPLAWTFWLIRDGSPGDSASKDLARWLGLVAAALVAAAISFWAPMMPSRWSVFDGLVRVVAQATLLICLATIFWNLVISRGDGSPHVARRHRSAALARSLVVLVALAVIALLDSVGLFVVSSLGSAQTLGAGIAVLLAAVLRSPLVTLAGKLKDRSLGPLPAGIAFLVAAAIVLGYFGGIAALPHLVFDAYADATGTRGVMALTVLALVVGIVVFATAHLWYFLNRSSMHALYEARLRRAYLGASNPERTGEGTVRLPITEPQTHDGLPRHEYDPSTAGGPIHLINVCVNETVDGQSQLQQRDRKGMGMAIGPAGVSVGVRHHALWTPDTDDTLDAVTITREIRSDLVQGVFGSQEAAKTKAAERFRVFPEGVFKPEDLEIGSWVAISGGAVSTGLGSRTNPALSLLLGLFNVRLGYWWNSGVNITRRVGSTTRTRTQQAMSFIRSFLPMQSALIDEWFARFPGTARPDWYLTDGGHFENLGGYELIRRSLPMIVLVDAEADAGHSFAGLANLVRKARTDFGAEIDFLEEPGIEALRTQVVNLPQCVGSLEALRRGRRETDGTREPGTERERVVVVPSDSALSLAHAALARVTYADRSTGWLLYLKPTLDGDEPTDVLEYHAAHPGFPHESTGDQFFDEAQWESYRRLGEHVATRVFGGESALAAQLRGEAMLGV